MKRWFWVWCVFISVNAFAQNRANVWMLGYTKFVPDCAIDFNSGFADTFSVWKDLEFFATNASICDSNGQVAFYTNGISIYNRENQPLFNSQGFNPGQQTTEDTLSGLSAPFGSIIIPHPAGNNHYSIFHISGEEILSGSQTQPLVFRYSEIDLTLDNNLGGIIDDKKGIGILNDTLVWGRISACKHSNGIDWWILTHKWNSDVYYKFLLRKDTLLGPLSQNIGSIISKDDIVGQGCFSPDGTQFAYMNRNFNFDFMHFDRCTGELSDAVNIILPDSNLSQGISFSPNNRFIYCNTYSQLFQFDTWAVDLQSSMTLIDTIPLLGSFDVFAVEMMAPDNKIYISTYNGCQALHVINNPDSLGTSCHFVRQGLTLSSYNSYSIPNHPNYDLGLSPSNDTCSSFYTNQSFQSINNPILCITPNPVSDQLNIIYQSEEDALFELFDLYGKRVGAISLYHYFKNRLLNVSHLPNGVYIATVTCKGAKVWSEQVVVQR